MRAKRRVCGIVLAWLGLLASLIHGSRATDALAAGRLDTTTALQQAQLVAVANDGLNKRDVAEQQQLVVEVANLMAQQVAQKVERQGQEEIKAKAEAVAGAFEGGARTRGRAGRAGGSGSTSAWNPTKRELAVMLDKDPDKYDDWLAIQHNKSTEIHGHKVHFPSEENDEIGRLPLRFSSHKCTGVLFQHRVCHFYNLILWNGTFLYITDDNYTVPDVQMTYIAAEPFKSKTNLSAVLNVTDPSKLVADALFDWATTPKVLIQDAIAFYMSYHNNYGHLMGETAPLMHSLLCTYFGRCSYSDEDREGLQIFMYNRQPNVTTIMPKAIREELWPCFSKLPVLRMNDGSLRGKAVVIRHVVAGVGPACRGFPWCRARFMRVGPSPVMMASWKERAMACVGLPTGLQVNAERPSVVIINRPLQHGRGFINAMEVAHQLEKDFKQLTVHVEELNEESLSSQATKYYRTDILIQMHGAALGNLVFLPKGAIYIDVVPENNDDKHTWAFFLGRDLMPLQVNPIALAAQRVELMESIISAMPEWKTLTKDQKQLVLKEHRCPPQSELSFTEVVCYIEWFMKRSNSYLNYVQVKEVMSVALESLDAWAYKRHSSYMGTAMDITDFRPDRELNDLV